MFSLEKYIFWPHSNLFSANLDAIYSLKWFLRGSAETPADHPAHLMITMLTFLPIIFTPGIMCDNCIYGTWLKKTSNSFFKTNLFKEWMNKFVAFLTKKKQPRMNGTMLALTFFEFYTDYIKKLGQFFFHHLLANLFKQRYIVLLLIFEQVNKWSKKTYLKMLCICT